MVKYLALHLGLMMEQLLGLIIEAHLGLMMDLSWVPQMAHLMVPMMANLWVHCLAFQLSPLISLQNIQAQFLLLILLLVCDFIFLVFIVLSDCFICRIHVILSQNYHINPPLKFPQA